MDRTCETLSAAEIIDINRQAIDLFGGRPFVEPGNFHNESSLLYILDAIHQSYFGHEPYPTIIEKAAGIGWTIIVEHVFNDANKRTGILTTQIFLELNGYDLRIAGLPLDSDVIDVAEKTAKHIFDKEDFTNWVKDRTTSLEN